MVFIFKTGPRVREEQLQQAAAFGTRVPKEIPAEINI
jgi:hypothetical protein